MPKIVKMPKPPPKAEEKSKVNGDQATAIVSKTTAKAEIILFPNGKDEIPLISSPATDPESETRWLRLADDALKGKTNRKKA